tara:strand:- start:22 stop:1698 length:1677 start_codon:yes stop_codon:yes gene_type:complete
MKKILILLMTFSVIVSCSEDFTDIDPVGSLSDASLQNATGVDLLLTGTYSVLDGIRNGGPGDDWTKTGDNWWLDVISDDAHKGSTDGDQADLYAIEIFDWGTTNPYFEGKWQALYAGVNRANGVIDLITKSENPADFDVQHAQAKFLRAHYNFELTRIWGNVSYISEENFANTEFNQPNTGPLWDQIESDLNFAVNNLPSSRGGSYSEAGRPIVSTAKAYLGKVQLYQGKFSDALTNLESVINSGDYALASDYFSNFRSDGENGPEAIFAIQFSADGGLAQQGNRGGTLNFNIRAGLCCGFYQPSIDLANAFQTENGLPLLDTYNQTDITNDYGVNSDEPHTPHTGPLDPRIDFTIGRRGIDLNGYGPNEGKDNVRAAFGDISGPFVGKKNFYTAGDDTNIGKGGWGEERSGINYHIIRYADVLLMAAEAAVETGNLEKARGYVNQVRQRAINTPRADSSPNYVIDTYNSTWTDTNVARKAVRFERRLELGMEGHRLFDLRRWGNFVDVMNTYIVNESRTISNYGQKSNPAQSKHMLLPIPLNAIDTSEGNLKQNPGF